MRLVSETGPLGNPPIDADVEEEEEPELPNVAVDITPETMGKMTVSDLKEELAIQNATCPGGFKKPEPFQRLKQALTQPVVGERKDSAKERRAKRRRRTTKNEKMTCPNLHLVRIGVCHNQTLKAFKSRRILSLTKHQERQHSQRTKMARKGWLPNMILQMRS